VGFVWLVFYLILEFSAIILSVVGNLIVIIVMLRDKNLRVKSNWFIISVACGDFLMGAVVIPLYVNCVSATRNFNSIIFKSLILQIVTGRPKTLHTCLIFLSIVLSVLIILVYSQTAVSIDRLCSVYFPMFYRNRTTTSVKWTLCFCWCLGIIGFFPVLQWNDGALTENRCSSRDIFDFDIFSFYLIVMVLIPTVLMTSAFVLIFIKITSLVS
jgi:hypothetical protein